MAVDDLGSKAAASVVATLALLDGLTARGLECDAAEVTPYAAKLQGLRRIVVVDDGAADRAEGRAALARMAGDSY